MNDNPESKVISIRSRKPLAETIAQEAKAEEQQVKKKEELKQGFIEAQLELLDKVREQIAAGNLENLILISRNPHSGMFMQDMIFEPNFHINGQAFAFAGLLEALKLEITDISQLTPTITADGTVMDPHVDDEDDGMPEEGDWQ